MKVIKQELLDRTVNYIKGISSKDKVAIIHDSDPDGVCSGVLIAKAIERNRGRPIDLRHNQLNKQHAINEETLALIKKNKINKLISTDLSLEEDPAMLKKLSDVTEILIIDHHKLKEEINNERIIMFKPQLVYADINPSKYCSAKLAFDLGSKVADISDLDWISAIGVIADVSTEMWAEFLDKVFLRYNLEKKKDWFESDLGKCAELISNTECFDDRLAKESFEIVYAAKNFEEVLNSKLKKYYGVVHNEINKWINELDKKAEFHDDLELIYYEITPKLNVKSPISTIVSFKYPNKTFIIVDIAGEEIHASGRRQDMKVKMNDLFEYAIKGILEGRGGGHIPAAGAVVPKKHYPEFKKRVFEYLKNMKKDR